jgi:hypothetical protein
LLFLFFVEDLLKLLPGICGCANLLGEIQPLPCQTVS